MLKLQILLPLALSLFGCATVPPLDLPTNMHDFNQAYILTHQPCSPPCWQGLTIGLSTGDEVVSTLSGLEFVDTSRLVVDEGRFPDFDPKADWVEGAAIRADCKNQRCRVDAVIVQDKLRSIRIEPDDGLMLAEVIESFGSPDYFRFILSTNPKYHEFEILWVEKQLLLYSPWPRHNPEDLSGYFDTQEDGFLPKDLNIVELLYLPIEEIHRALERREYFTEFKGTK